VGRAHGKARPAAGVGENPQNPGFSWLLKVRILNDMYQGYEQKKIREHF
jgi:hypothetical protein